MTRSHLKIVFWPPAFFGGIGASFPTQSLVPHLFEFKGAASRDAGWPVKFYFVCGSQILEISICIIVFCLLSIGLDGCVKQTPVEESVGSRQEVAREKPQQPEVPAGPSPRAQASLKLTDQGRRLIDAGEADNAIRVLEQAISLNPANGQNYYYLSEAWLMKGFTAEARQFNRLAESHLTGDEDWEKLVTRQAGRIAKLEEKIKKSR
jgi:tetratricopeptide (TPR) repeat protein